MEQNSRTIDALEHLITNWPERLAKRASVIRAFLDSQDSAAVARRLEIPRQFVDRCVKAYQAGGIPGLADYPRAGRPVDDKSLLAIHNFLVNEKRDQTKLLLAADQSSRSKSSIWRAARMTGTTISRNTKPSAHVSISDQLAEIGLVGCFFSKRITVLAFQGEKPWVNACEPSNLGNWLNPPHEYARAAAKMDEPITLQIGQALEIFERFQHKEPKPRAFKELWKRWLNTLLYSEPALAQSLVFEAIGDIHGGECYQLLQEAKHSLHPSKDKVSTNSKTELFVSLDKWVNQGTAKQHEEFVNLISRAHLATRDETSGVFAWCRGT